MPFHAAPPPPPADIPMDDLSPVISVHEVEVAAPQVTHPNGGNYNDVHPDDVGRLVLLRVFGAIAHISTCVYLSLPLADFFIQSIVAASPSGLPTGSIEVAVLLFFIIVDGALDLLSVIRQPMVWGCKSIMMRFLCGLGYAAILSIYAIVGHGFFADSGRYKLFDGDNESYIILFLIILGNWDIIHTAMHCHPRGNPVLVWPQRYTISWRAAGSSNDNNNDNSGRTASQSSPGDRGTAGAAPSSTYLPPQQADLDAPLPGGQGRYDKSSRRMSSSSGGLATDSELFVV